MLEKATMLHEFDQTSRTLEEVCQSRGYCKIKKRKRKLAKDINPVGKERELLFAFRILYPLDKINHMLDKEGKSAREVAKQFNIDESLMDVYMELRRVIQIKKQGFGI